MRIACIALLMCLTAFAPRPPVKIQFDADTDFTVYKSYNWLHPSLPAGFSGELYVSLQTAMNRALTAKGFTPSESAQFAVELVLLGQDRVQIAGSGVAGGVYSYSDWGEPHLWSEIDKPEHVNHVHRATLVVHIYDAKTKELVWRGTVNRQFKTKDLTQARINDVVDAVVAQFPPDVRCQNIASLYEPCNY
jgi:Domain of unknown function (DUF4136)